MRMVRSFTPLHGAYTPALRLERVAVRPPPSVVFLTPPKRIERGVTSINRTRAFGRIIGTQGLPPWVTPRGVVSTAGASYLAYLRGIIPQVRRVSSIKDAESCLGGHLPFGVAAKGADGERGHGLLLGLPFRLGAGELAVLQAPASTFYLVAFGHMCS